jgi:hypothetical protein
MHVVIRRLPLTASCLGALTLAAGCGASASSITYEHYTVSCCQISKDLQPYQAGGTLIVHWLVWPSGRTSSRAATQLALTATLEGPYASATDLKSGPPAPLGNGTPTAYTLHAPAITTTDRVSSVPLGAIQLPADLPPGYYDLVTEVAGPDFTTSGYSMVQVIG